MISLLLVFNSSVVSQDFIARVCDVIRFEQSLRSHVSKSQDISQACKTRELLRRNAPSPRFLANYTSFIDEGQVGNDH